jgi:hypothetical protein
LQLPIELRLSSWRHHGAYCGLFVSCLGLLGFAFVFPITRLQLTSLRCHGCGFVVVQVRATVLLYNYYHRKQFPQLEFATPDRFCLSASLNVRSKNLLMCLNQAQNRLGNGAGAGISVTDKAIIDACDIAEALDPTKDSPEMIMWPISKVAVLLLNRRKKVCLLEHGSETKGVWSMFEKDITMALFEKDIKTALGGSLSSDMSVQGSSNKSMALPSELYVLQQIAYSEVELKTGSCYTLLRFFFLNLQCIVVCTLILF